ncbi:serine/threonine protein kinase [Saprolegnia parasitica CBS 223.65]|uniref:Serine/threonine protein kinase n=1 Tax=Saprolegnia parasitica (strain CBS 223.65) TaxID=695850 RepID=A0A067CDB7_SAPPC|nr:serine/threonine protein kinase [Saprolegnia parasitica CBS 223.65]KDO28724.1 serine/threonine protein kinase [Saprolegnia parasitica CBS 223.65]|eukprot:XP_012200364.1 serine/threonine protein kinase [Saprolegnia parasitica CBS 223.65]
MKNYLVERELAHALYGRVLLCRDSTQRVVVKRLDLRAAAERRSVDDGRLVAEDATMEKHVHGLLAHDHIVALHETFCADGFEHFVMEYCPRGELFQELQRQPSHRFEPTRAHDCFIQVATAVAFMHERGFAHCDLSLENVFVDAAFNCKVGDFGLAAPTAARKQTPVGKRIYMAPEMLSPGGYAPEKADVWALGIMLFIMLTGCPLFGRADDSDSVFRYVQAHGLAGVLRGWKLDHLVNKDCLHLLKKLLDTDPKRRPAMKAVMKHPYVRDGLRFVEITDHVGRFFKALWTTPRDWRRSESSNQAAKKRPPRSSIY